MLRKYCHKPGSYRSLSLAIATIFAGACTSVHSQDVDFRALGSGYAHLVSFEAEPEIAAATFTINSDDPDISDTDLNTIKLPLYREFDSDTKSWSWYAQGTLSYLDMDSSSSFEIVPQLRATIGQEWTAYGGLVEAGLIFPLGSGFSVATGLGLGVSRLENEANFSSDTLEDILAPVLEGRLYNWDTNASVARGNLGLRYDQEHGNYRLKGSAHFSYSYIDSFGESSDFAGFSDHAGTVTVKLDVRHPLNVELREKPIDIIGHVGNTSFVGSNRDELGFEYFNEIGVSLGREKLTLGLLAVLGDEVDGWTLIFNYDY
jgi:opacity protein-like surface antigen